MRSPADPLSGGIPLLCVTAFAMKGDEEKIRAGGFDDYMAKPISVSRFFDMMERFAGADAL